MIRSGNNTMLTREEYRELVEKVAKKVADKLPEDANPLMAIATAVDTILALKIMEEELFAEEEE